MRKLLQLAMVGASAFAALASATSGRNSGHTYNDPNSGNYTTITPLVRHQAVPVSELDGIQIEAVPYGASGWTLRIRNTTASIVSVRWDESTFALANGRSTGRLIRGETRKMDVSKEQPATPIAPGSLTDAVAFPESLVDQEETEGKLAAAGYVPRPDADRVEELRRQFYSAFIGAKIILTIETADGKKTWTGVVESTRTQPVAPASAKFWCVGVGSDGLGGNCAEERADCVKLHDEIEKMSPGVRACEAAKSAWCYDIADEHRRHCWDTEARCEEQRADVSRRAFGVGPCADMF
jgi:hypothetical protein